MTSAFLLDLCQCIGCQGCVLACNTGNELGDGVQYIEISESVRGTFPDLTGGFANHRCYHCTDAACVSVCPTGSLFQTDGLTRVDPSICSGCRYCTQACPWQVPTMVNGVARKCDGCHDTVQAGGTPWCVQTCPSDALKFGPRDEIAAEAHFRAAAYREARPNAQVYGESQAGGLGMLVVLPDDPEVLGLPVDPDPPLIAATLKRVVQPVAVGVLGATIAGAGIAAVIARRNQQRLAAAEGEAEVPAGVAAAEGSEDDEVTS